MSFLVNTYEKIEIKNSSKQTKEVIKLLSEYIRQFEEKRCIEDFNVLDMRLSINGMLYNDRRAIFVYSKNLEKIKEITFEVYFSIMQVLGSNYGYSYWIEFFKDKKPTLTKNVSYKCLEFYDSNEDVVAYNFGADFIGEVPYNAKKDDVDHIGEWFCNNFLLSANFSGDIEPKMVKELMEEVAFLKFKYHFLDEIEEPFDNEFRFGSEVFARGDFNNFLSAIQIIIDHLLKMGANVNLGGVFTPADCDDFSAIKILLDENNQAIAEYCSFN